MSWWKKALGLEHAERPRSRKLDTGTVGGADLDQLLAARFEIPIEDAADIRRTVFATIAHEMDEGRRVRVPRFGEFSITRTYAHQQEAFGKVVDVPTRDHPRWRPFQSLTDEIAATPPEEG